MHELEDPLSLLESDIHRSLALPSPCMTLLLLGGLILTLLNRMEAWMHSPIDQINLGPY
jgi:hypothetical protein